VILRACVLALVLLTSGCGVCSGSRGEERLVGAWISSRGEVIEFTHDGRVHTRDGTNRMNGHWEAVGPNELRIRWDRSDAVVVTEVTYTDEGDLMLPDVAPGVIYARSR
jgi:hypothetical protein